MTESGKPPGTATLSLMDLRRGLIRKASSLGAQARALRARGDHSAAYRLEQQAQRIRAVARQMRTSASDADA